MSERQPHNPDWSALLEQALSVEGSLGNSFNRFHAYSTLNKLFLVLQGCPVEPIATFNRWKDAGRYVKRGSKAFSIIRPIVVKREDQATGEEKQFLRFKDVRCIFPVSMTDGDELPPYEPPEWSKERALGELGIREVAFRLMDGDTHGYSHDREVAINPVAPEPFPTLLHEIAHIEHGHTAPEKLAAYVTHRGLYEFEAEGTAYLALSDIAVPEDRWNRSESRAYIQHYLKGQRPTETSIRQVFKITDRILNAGRETAVETTPEAA